MLMLALDFLETRDYSIIIAHVSAFPFHWTEFKARHVQIDSSTRGMASLQSRLSITFNYVFLRDARYITLPAPRVWKLVS